ncbi:MAG: hypothetical protein O2968_23665, partial [Acidobacteria bacterium]|nr:hypothetical protein [Acidobacteriota bacterium]
EICDKDIAEGVNSHPTWKSESRACCRATITAKSEDPGACIGRDNPRIGVYPPDSVAVVFGNEHVAVQVDCKSVRVGNAGVNSGTTVAQPIGRSAVAAYGRDDAGCSVYLPDQASGDKPNGPVIIYMDVVWTTDTSCSRGSAIAASAPASSDGAYDAGTSVHPTNTAIPIIRDENVSGRIHVVRVVAAK